MPSYRDLLAQVKGDISEIDAPTAAEALRSPSLRC